MVPPAYPTLVRMTPLAAPKRASGNQNQLIPNVAFFVGTCGSNRVMAGVPRSRTWGKRYHISFSFRVLIFIWFLWNNWVYNYINQMIYHNRCLFGYLSSPLVEMWNSLDRVKDLKKCRVRNLLTFCYHRKQVFKGIDLNFCVS